MAHVTQHSVPRVLMKDQRENRMNTSGDLGDSDQRDGMFQSRVITEDETWCFL
jgi:hypothetical protein